MVLGLNRSRLRTDASALFAIRTTPIKLVQARDWASERGVVLFECNADLVGGFPGYAERGCRLDGVRLTITDRFFLVDECQPGGFGLPLRWIEGTALAQSTGRSDCALRIFYRESGSPRCFTIRFGASRLGSRGVSRSMRAQSVLRSAGLVDRFAIEPPLEPSFTLPWDQTREFESENAIWTGRATAPLQVGSENIPSDVWLTTKSLIWGGGVGTGLNRIPLTLLMDMVSMRLKDRVGTPAVYISIGDARTGRFELPFVFDLDSPPDRNFRERGAFVVGLRSRGLPEGKSSPLSQPWRVESNPRPLTDDEEIELPDGSDLPIDPGALTIASVEAIEDDRGLAHAALRRIERIGRSARTVDDGLVTEIRILDADPAGQIEAVAPSVTAVSEVAEAPESFADEIEFDVVRAEADHPAAPREIDLDSGGAWFVDLDGPIVPLTVDVVTAGNHQSLSAIIDAALSDVAIERDPTEPFLTIVSGNDASPIEDLVLAEWAFSDDHSKEAEHEDLQLTETWSAVTASESSERLEVSDEIDQIVDIANSMGTEPLAGVDILKVTSVSLDPWAVARRYEETAIGALAEALRVIDDRVANNSESPLSEAAPSSWEQSQAVSEIANLVGRGVVTPEDGRTRRERLLALGDVSVRLRTLVELFDGGYLTVEELDAKRSKLVKLLSSALIP